MTEKDRNEIEGNYIAIGIISFQIGVLFGLLGGAS